MAAPCVWVRDDTVEVPIHVNKVKRGGESYISVLYLNSNDYSTYFVVPVLFRQLALMIWMYTNFLTGVLIRVTAKKPS